MTPPRTVTDLHPGDILIFDQSLAPPRMARVDRLIVAGTAPLRLTTPQGVRYVLGTSRLNRHLAQQTVRIHCAGEPFGRHRYTLQFGPTCSLETLETVATAASHQGRLASLHIQRDDGRVTVHFSKGTCAVQALRTAGPVPPVDADAAPLDLTHQMFAICRRPVSPPAPAPWHVQVTIYRPPCAVAGCPAAVTDPIMYPDDGDPSVCHTHNGSDVASVDTHATSPPNERNARSWRVT